MRLFHPLFLILLLSVAPAVQVVQGSHHVKKSPGPVYISPDGKIYVKHGQPIYLRLATSPDEGAPSYLLRNDVSKNLKKPVVPFLFEGHGEHTLIHPKDHKNIQKRKGAHHFRVYDDAISPQFKISITQAPKAITGKTVVYGKPVTLTLHFTDEDSGLFAAYYSVNDSEYGEYVSPFPFLTEKDYILKFYALDNVGNRSKRQTRYYALDFTAPRTSHEVKGPYVGNILSPKSTIRLKSFDSKAGVKQIDYWFKGQKGRYKSVPLDMKGLSDGQHKLIYAAIDRVENAEANFEYSFYLDKIPPLVRYSIAGDQHRSENILYVSERSRVVLDAEDNKAGVRRIRYYLAQKNMGIYAEPFPFRPKDGPTTFAYAASDNVINISKITVQNVTVDISAPVIKPVFTGEHYFSRKTHYIRKATKISFSARDNLSGVQSMAYQVDQGLRSEENKKFSIEIEGLHQVRYSAKDNVNNETETMRMNLFVDEAPPEIFHHFSVEKNVPDQEIYPPKMLLFLASTDEQSGVRNITYRINGGTKKKYTSAALSFNKVGDYIVTVESIDNVGNLVMKSINFQVRRF